MDNVGIVVRSLDKAISPPSPLAQVFGKADHLMLAKTSFQQRLSPETLSQ